MISLAAEKIAQIGSFPITNTFLTSIIAAAILILIAVAGTKNLRIVPRGLQNFLEFIIESLANFIDSITGHKEETKKFLPLVATLFIFILTANWMGLLPGFGPLGVFEEHGGKTALVPFFRSANSDLNTTLALAVVSVLGTQIFGIAAIGAFKYSKRFFNFKNPILFFVGILELIAEIAKMVSFSFRLFGNIFAGEVLLVVMGSLVPYIAPLPFYFLELFVGLIQALVFAMLTLVFLKIATAKHAEH